MKIDAGGANYDSSSDVSLPRSIDANAARLQTKVSKYNAMVHRLEAASPTKPSIKEASDEDIVLASGERKVTVEDTIPRYGPAY
ncbi:hypothetical protein BGX28_003270 [Mortierella sp. GBA30]|nr:hypothetical protein BGX28_003270 [Mortierella sp. GBA30]